MKIFDFSSGTKGKLLGHTPCSANWFGSGLYNGKLVQVGRYGMHWDGGRDLGDNQWSLARMLRQYGVEAICYCEDYEHFGTGSVWVWSFTATVEWVQTHAPLDLVEA